MSEVIVLHNFNALDRYLKRLPIKMKDRVGKFWATTTKYVLRDTVKHFREERDPDGFPWERHSQLTINARRKGRKSKRSPKILQDKGILIKSNIAVQTSPSELRVENRLPYAAPNQYGAKMQITRSQAWWMIFNLFGFDPDKPWKFTIGFGQRRPTRGITKKMKQGRLTWLGWRRATRLAMALLGKTLRISKRMFLGFSKKNEDDILNIWLKWFDRIVKEK